MQKKSLFETNRYLKDSANYRNSLLTNVSSSTAIETGDSIKSIIENLTATKGSIFCSGDLKRK